MWVENYKNIKKQGFNFSPRFECKFHDEYDEDGKLKDDCKLEIKPKEHIKNFFGDNINITAIVGKNGSGKSSVLELLIEVSDTFFNTLLYPQTHQDLEENFKLHYPSAFANTGIILFFYDKYKNEIFKSTIYCFFTFLGIVFFDKSGSRL